MPKILHYCNIFQIVDEIVFAVVLYFFKNKHQKLANQLSLDIEKKKPQFSEHQES